MSKAQGLMIESKLGRTPQKLVKWGEHIHYFESREHPFSYLKRGQHIFSYLKM